MQHRQAWPVGLDTNPRALRSPSISSEVMSISAKSTNTVTPHANPPPAYVAPIGASNLVSSELDRSVVPSPQALTLVNEFLDQVLFNILSTARSVSLGALRTAVPSVLKPRLGKAAVRVAEEELKEYLEDEEEAELNSKKATLDVKQGFDLELAWKLARLRCMVYAQLGDLEEEDEEEWLEKEQLLVHASDFRREHNSEISLGPAAAIFLASVVEYLGQQALYYAAQHALKRHDAHQAQSLNGGQQTATLTPNTDEIVLEGKDMNHVGRDSPLSRLWRSWRRNTRDLGSAPMSPDTIRSPISPTHSRSGSQVPVIQGIAEETDVEKSPSQIPLPMNENDVDEIEVPGLASAVSDSEDDTPHVPERSRRRPASMVAMPGAFPSTAAEASAEEDIVEPTTRNYSRPIVERKRSLSSPTPYKGPLKSLRTRRPAEGVVPPSMPVSEVPTATIQADEISTPARRRDYSSPHEPGTPNKRDGMVGGALAAAVGALGAGATVVGVASSQGEQELKAVAEAERLQPSPPPEPRKTAVEQMLGVTSSKPPHQNSAAGSSITSVADFDSMYVPVPMSTDDFTSAYSPIDAEQQTIFPNVSANTGQTARTDTTSKEDRWLDETVQRSQLPASTSSEDLYRTPGAASNQVASNNIVKPQASAFNNERENKGTEPATESPDSMPLSRAAGTGGPTYDGRLDEETPVHRGSAQHAYSRSQVSMHSQASKSSSSSSRILGFTRDPSGRPHTLSQQYVDGTLSDSVRGALASTPVTDNREGRPSTAGSSSNKAISRAQNLRTTEQENEQKKKSLEVLIQSNETLHYTLTPASVMKVDQPASPRRTETQDMADFIRNTGPPGSETSRVSRPPTTVASYVNDNISPETRDLASGSTPRKRGVIPSSRKYPQASPSPHRPRNPLGEARSPIVERSTAMRDLADYARSTGPQDASQFPRALSVPATASPASSNATGKAANRLKFQARDARPTAEDNSDLIDFIRQGPPRNAGDHRIDRRVAPFRTTMDSEDLNGMAPDVRDSPAAYSAPSTQDERSAQVSTDSRTALLAANNRSANDASGTGSSRVPKQFREDDAAPRTRRPVKDPYAIDYSDDYSDDDLEYAERAHNNEESLIDFLRNTAPPPGSSALPILTSISVNTPVSGPAVPEIKRPTSSARESSPHLTQAGSKMDKYRPTQSTHAAHIERNRNKIQVEARDARPNRNDTSELAEYLKNSGPPASTSAQAQPIFTAQSTAQSQKEGGLFRAFTKRKK